MKPADRKKQLIAQGRVYRAEVVLAKEAVRAALRPEALARNILGHAAISAIAAFRHRSSDTTAAGLSASTLLPLLMSGVSALSKKTTVLKPILRGALIGSVVASALALVLKKKPAAPDQP